MRNELSYFSIGRSYGGNQNWFRDLMMKMGGCAAATACDVCIQMAFAHNRSQLYPYDINQLDKDDYIKFSNMMKPYLRPRLQGIDTLDLFINGFNRYINDRNESNISLNGFSGERSVNIAITEVKKMIDLGIPIPYLLLRHKNPNYKNLTWHWFLIIGYEDFDNEFKIKIATYGEFFWISFSELWETGYNRKGGMVLLKNI